MEPLNLVKRKNRPVAVVAPSTVLQQVSSSSPPPPTPPPAAFPSALLSSLYVNSVINDQLFQRAAQYGAAAGGPFWPPANIFWQVMQQQHHHSAAQHYASTAASKPSSCGTAFATSAGSCSAAVTTCASSKSSSSSSSSSATTDRADGKRSVSPANNLSVAGGSAARPQNDHGKNSSCSDGSKHPDSVQNSNNQDKKKPHIKKPLNAFMLYMKEMRAKVVAECTLKESAAINQILGRRWHALGREEQAKYYELARRERQIHMQLYPDWSSRTNATRAKKRKRKQETHDGGNNSMKKCRARYGLDQQNQWCKPCSPDGAGGGSILAQHVHGPSNAASPQGPTYVNL